MVERVDGDEDMTGRPMEPIQRFTGYDVLKGITIVLVVLGHANRGAIESHLPSAIDLQYMDWLIYMVHMPVFFFVSGYLSHASIKRNSTVDFIKRSCGRILYLYVIWSIIVFGVGFAIGKFIKINHPITVRDLLSIGYEPINILWFLYALLVYQTSAALAHRWPLFLLMGALVADLALSSSGTANSTAFGAQLVSQAPAFFIGFVLAGKQPIMLSAMRRPGATSVLCLVAFLGLAAIVYGAKLTKPVQFSTMPITALGIIALGAASIWICSSTTYLKNILISLGRKSLAIYLLHIFMLALVPRLLQSLSYDTTIARIVFGTLIGILGSYVIYYILEATGVVRIVGLK